MIDMPMSITPLSETLSGKLARTWSRIEELFTCYTSWTFDQLFQTEKSATFMVLFCNESRFLLLLEDLWKTYFLF